MGDGSLMVVVAFACALIALAAWFATRRPR